MSSKAKRQFGSRPTQRKTKPAGKTPRISNALRRRSERLGLSENADRYRVFFERALEGMFWSTPEGRFIEVNPAFARMLGYGSPEEVLALSLPEDLYVDPLDRERLRTHYETSGVVDGVELLWKKKEGEPIVVSLYARVIRDAQDRPICYEGMVLDVTTRKREEEALWVNEERFSSLSSALPIGIYHTDRNGAVIYTNQAWREISGLTQKESLGQGWTNAIAPEDREDVLAAWQACVENGQEFFREYRIVQPNGEVSWVHSRAAAMRSGTKKLIGYVATVENITERKEVEETLRESQKFIQLIATTTPAILYIYDFLQQRTIYHNGKLFTILGYVAEDLKLESTTFHQIIHPDDLPNFLKLPQRLATAKEGDILVSEYRMRHNNGEWRWFRSLDTVFSRTANGLPKQMLGTAQDITESKQAESILRESEMRYRTVSELTSDYAYSVYVKADGTLVSEWFTDAFTRIFGFTIDEVRTQVDWDRLIHPDDLPIVTQRKKGLLSGQSDISEYRALTKSGEVRWLRDHSQPVWDEGQGRVVRIIGASQDITEQKRMETMLKERAMQEQELPANLRRFRNTLSLSQSDFGKTFGGYSQRQINTYERGEVEVPVKLLLTIREKGYPLEAVIGMGKTDAIDEVLGYLASGRKIFALVKYLSQTLVRLSEQESDAINKIFHQLGLPDQKEATKESRMLRELFSRDSIFREKREKKSGRFSESSEASDVAAEEARR